MTERVAAQTVQVKPWFLLIVDTSGSMYDDSPSGGNACTNGATGQPACTTCSGCVTQNSCGWPKNRISDAKCAIRNILNSTGDAEFALMQFRHPCRADCASQGNGNMATTCDADMVVGISASNYTPLSWVDNVCPGVCTGGFSNELYAYGYTPIGKSLERAKEYFTTGVNGFSPPSTTDMYTGCRPTAVILLTDGAETCGGSATTAATSLLTSVVPSPTGNQTIAIKTYPIAFGLPIPTTAIENIAINGNTDAPGTHRGFYAQDEETLSAALNQIIIDSQLNERCDGRDNDCDARIDEDNAKYCDVLGRRTQNPQVPSIANPAVLVAQNVQDTRLPACSGTVCPVVQGKRGDLACAQPEWAQSSTCDDAAMNPPPNNILCTSPGELCNGADDDCDGRNDEAAAAIAESNEVCGDNTDNDCDGSIDEDCNGCIAQPEICNGFNEDCDARVDEGLTRPCAINLGECAGTQTCVLNGPPPGAWSACKQPVPEICNGLDDNCDGAIDGNTQPCGVTSTVGLCHPGVQTCVNGTFGTCTGSQGPTLEVCDKLDNDCSGLPDNDGAADTRVNQSCGTDTGVCNPGTTACVNGEIACQGAIVGSAELCNGLDDDCDTRIDEGVAASDVSVGQPCIAPGGVVMSGPVAVTGECRLGTTVCSGGALICPGYIGPTLELCDALDQNCNGNPIDGVAVTDPRVNQSCGTDLGACAPGTLQCVVNALVCTGGSGVGTETCNSIDDDCDGLTDENLPAVATTCDGPPAHGNVGLCKTGNVACIGGMNVCQGEVKPTAEICDGEDNDCDTQVDEGNPGAGVVCGTTIGLCTTGTTVCTNGDIDCPNDIEPVSELCDGEDNDCDGLTDEDNPEGGADCRTNEQGADVIGTCRTSTDPTMTALPLNQPCGECRFGTEVCQAGELVCLGTVGKEDELCDGLDNDCDSSCVVDLSDPDNISYKCPTARCALPANDPNFLHCLDNIDEGVGTPTVPGTDPNIGQECAGGGGACMQGFVECVDGAPTCVGGQVAKTETCNGIDDDCDGETDEGFAVGDPCGTNVGECQAGTFVCTAGMVKCDGEVSAGVEICNGVDDDCDTKIDEGNPGGGKACGSDEGECSQGLEQCVGGKLVCAGGAPSTPEVCDCLDNDCDGMKDEPNANGGSLCSGGSACVNCQCAPPCDDSNEFGMPCARGRAAVINEETGKCFCEAELCDVDECAGERLERQGEVECEPGSDLVGACVCKQNICVGRCSGVVCQDDDLICDPTTGKCEAKTCLRPQLRCAETEFCDVTTGACAEDLCAKASCAEDQACRDGKCFGSCAGVTCAAGELCNGGKCVADKCAASACEGGKVCDPSDGKCVAAGACVTITCNGGLVCDAVSGDCEPDPCLRTTCPEGQICTGGECELRCAVPLVDCAGVCVDPSKDRQHCGASANCSAENAGFVCQGKQVCSEGECSDNCKTGLNCGGECIDPQTDALHCGAQGDCTGKRAGVACPEGSVCTTGVCRAPPKPFDPEDEQRIVVTGGGGCACTVGTGAQDTRSLPWVLVLSVLGLVLSRRRLRAAITAPITAPPATRGWLALLALAALPGVQGCKVDTFCLNCEEQASTVAGNNGGFGNVDAGGGGVNVGEGGAPISGDSGPSGNVDSGVGSNTDAGPIACIDHEICNGRDDDCDSRVDEGTDPVAEGIKIKVDPNNCGACGNICTLAHAFNECVNGTCKIRECDPVFTDLDRDPKNGCEYACTKQADTDTVCDRRDDDCDGTVDDDIDLRIDMDNCGSCGNGCSLPHASGGSECKAGVCELDDQKCDTGYVDADHAPLNGCEYECTPKNGGDELCNKIDDDCDTKIDEGVGTTDPLIGVACGTGTGLCDTGVSKCVNGAPICQGGKGPKTEACDGDDNDCDGNTDENFSLKGLPCGTDTGECVRGNRQCENEAIVCVGGVDAVDEVCDGKDNDCDGLTDETNATDGPPEGVGSACRTVAGVIELNPPTAIGACRLGVAVCSSGQLVCDNEQGPQPELCDAMDQDCNGNDINGVSTTDSAVGVFCANDVGECSFGTTVCDTSTKTRICQGGVLPAARELCNGKDDDCDGSFDEIDAATMVPPIGAGEPCRIDSLGAVHHGATETVNGECKLGLSVCSGGVIACPIYTGPAPQTCSGPKQCTSFVGPTPELCNAKNDDCDATTDEGVASTDPALGQVCPGNNVGACDTGSTFCNAQGVVSCPAAIGPSTELCDNVDNDCNAATLDGAVEPTRGQVCGISTGACATGTRQCVGGAMQCSNQTSAMPEVCDSVVGMPNDPETDDDCDGLIDEDFQLSTNVNRCGACNNVCSITNATPRCVGGVCEIASCLPGYHNNPTTPAADCSVGPCTIGGNEICNTLDDDCDGTVNDGLVTPTNACNVIGACAGATVSCVPASGWVCSKLPAVETCNTLDDDCDGKTDEGFNLGAVCNATGVGACATAGTIKCSAGAAACLNASNQPVTTGTATQELCNGKDDDCDATTDEPCTGAPAVGCVTDSWITLASGSSVYKYEASRPDATPTGSGSAANRACSTLDRLPWTNVTYLQAQAACKAADPTARLCTEAEWEEACMDDQDSVTSCTWAFPQVAACNTWSASTCNGSDYNVGSSIQSTGHSGATSSCFRGPNSDVNKQIFELSGNVKEYTLQRATGAIPVRGGATNNTQDGLRCDFDFPVWPNDSPFVNVGFRCCRNPTPLPTVCTTYQATGLNATHATLATHTIAVSQPMLVTISDLNVVNFAGTHNTMSQVNRIELVGPDGTTVRLLDQAYCGNNDNWNYVFDQQSATALPVSNTSPCGNGASYRPFESLAAFNGKALNGNWTIRVYDNSSSGGTSSPRINSWGVRLCSSQN